MAFTKVWTPDAVTGPVLAMVDGSVVPIELCSAAASFCACAVAWDTCMFDETLLTCLAVWHASTRATVPGAQRLWAARLCRPGYCYHGEPH